MKDDTNKTTDTANTETATVFISDAQLNYGVNCPVCGEFQKGVSALLWCDKCGETLKDIILERRKPASYPPIPSIPKTTNKC